MLKLSRLATLTVVALVPTSVSLVLPLSSSTAAPEPVKPDVATHRLVPGSSQPDAVRVSAVDLAEARARADGRSVLVRSASPAVAVPSGLSVAGVTWKDGSGADVSVQYRIFSRGAWEEWAFVDVDEEHAPDDGTAPGPTRDGSAPIVVTHAEKMQVRVIGPEDAASPVDAQLMVVDPGASGADEAVRPRRAGAADAAARRPYVYTRAQWGADESLRLNADPDGPSYGAVRAAFVHHTDGSNTYTSDQVPGLIRGIYAYHIGTYDPVTGALKSGKGWGDIGYNFLVDRFGRTWEGRYGGTTKPVIGAHAYGVNSYTFGVSVLGNFQTVAPPSSVVSALSQLIAWKAQVHEFDPSRRAKIAGVVYDGINGHRDAYNNSTLCPGTLLYGQLPTIRANVASLVRGVPSLSIDRDVDNHNNADVLATNEAGDLLLFPTTNARGVDEATTLEAGTWTGRDEVHVTGDWDGDGAVDVISRVTETGALELHAGVGDGTIEAARQIGNGWSGFDALIAPGDWNGDGRVDLVGRIATDGSLRLYPGNGVGGFARPYQIGNGWGGMRLISGVGDWDGDGARDLLAVASNGPARVYRGNGSGGFAGYLALPGDWSERAKVIGVGDTSNDMRVDVLSIGPDGQAEMGLRGASATEVTWTPVATSFATVEAYSG